MNSYIKQEIESFLLPLFQMHEIEPFVVSYEATPLNDGAHVALAAFYTFQYGGKSFQGHCTFHLNIFRAESRYVFAPAFDQILFISDMLDPLQYAEADAKKTKIPLVANIVRQNQAKIKDWMIKMFEDSKFNS